MRGVTILHSRKEPYPHDYLIGRFFLWMFPKYICPNHITIFRMLATPAVFFLVATERWAIGIPVFLIVAFTDVLDGTMARMRNQVTAWGTMFDPLADKFLVGGVLFILILKYVDIFIGGAIIFLELIVIVGAWLKKKEGVVISASYWGKTKMVLQVLGITLILLSLYFSAPTFSLLAEWTLILSIGFGVLSILGKDSGI
ncbi:MAG: CDP-alcohol phosphatidyltransferase family protein [Patescibacteria group bacterium]